MSIPPPPAPDQPPVPPTAPDGSAPVVPAPYATTPPPAYTEAVGQPAAVPGKKNVVALIAMIVAIVGFIFACIPGALIVGWILLPIAFVLSIVSLFLKGERKWMGVVGLIVSIIGTIVGFVVFFALIAGAVDEAIGSGDTTVSQPVEEDAEPAADADEPADAATEGTRENPYPLKSAVSNEDWTVVVNSYTVDGNPIVAKNGFNDTAPAGSHYEVVNYTVTYNGAEKGMAAEAQIAAVTSAGNVVNSYDNLVILDDGFGLDEMYKGASATGSEAFLVPDGETVLLRVTPGMFADEVFVKP